MGINNIISASFASVLQILLLSSSLLLMVASQSTYGYGAKHSEEYCAMYDICGESSDGKVLNCPYGSPSVKPDDLLSAKIQSLCPTITGNVCCTEQQFDTLRVQVQQAVPILVGCPACLRNFLNLFCELSCSPNQSLFINVTSISEVNGNKTVDGIDFYVTETFGEGLYDSCKDVKFGTMNTRAIDFVGAGASNYKEWFAFLGTKVPPGFPGSPYSMNFKITIPDPSPMELMNASVYSCNDTSLGCSCGDCPSSPVCSHPEPSPPRKDPCSIRIGSLKVRCVEFSMAILYVVLICMFFGWVLLQRRRERRRLGSDAEPLLNDMVGEGGTFSNNQKDGAHPGEVQFSFVQGCLSRWIAGRPTIVLCSSVAIVLLLCLGLLRFEVETRPEKLWVGPGSKAAEEKEFFDSHLAPFYRIEQLIIATIPESEHEKPPSIITEDNIQLLFEIQQKYFQMDPDNYDNYGGVEHAEYCFQHYTSAETCFSAFKAPLEPTTALGGFFGDNYSEASAFIITYPVNNAMTKVGDENGKAIAWEKAFIQLAKEELLPMVQSSNLTLSFSTESSIEEELKRESTADVITILVSYIVMFAYISVTLGDTPSHQSSFYLSSKVLLGLSGVLLVVLSVLGSVGFFSFIGVKSTLIIMEVIPFLVLAVGVDNMCIIVDAVKRQPSGLPIEEQITLAVLLDFLLQITAFVALVTLDFLRTKDNRIDCFPCIKVNSSSEEESEGIREERDGLLTRYMKEVHAPFLGLWGVKVLVIAVFVAFTLASIAVCTRIEPGLEQQIALPRDSYLQGYFSNISEYLRVGPPLYFVVKDYNYSLESKHTNQLCSISQCDSNSLLNEPPCCFPDEGPCGLGGVCKDCTTCFRHSDLVNDRPTTAQFREKLPWFLDALPSADCAKGGHGAYTNSVDLNGFQRGVIRASEFRTYHTPVNRQGDYVNALRAARDFSSRMSASLKMDIFPYSVFYIFFEQYLDIWKIALINLATALGAVFVVCLVITSSLWSSAIILLVLVMIILDIMGVMAILGIQLNAVSVVNLVMSIGIAVEFCVHIAHAFMVSSGDRGQRAKTALCTMGASVFSGITLTKLVGVLVLCFSTSEIFVVYYFQMYLALVIIGFLHGLVFLPIFSREGAARRRLILVINHNKPPQDHKNDINS
ncbi:NPC intracellular cholesterol transporter 1 [Stylosanthes scabra]|uniref:NPC intracellular cholesterol transporter 1 n=1 Tax=Stylosanthes scabra TaxID=79078 RepID=A0ABU6Q3D7_9FABA|nr:NPC intracellular cholesterol transporter 1 [Stylosanthes scabra]